MISQLRCHYPLKKFISRKETGVWTGRFPPCPLVGDGSTIFVTASIAIGLPTNG